MNFTDEELKELTMKSLTRSLTNIYRCYNIIYDVYHTDNANRDVAFIHDLVNAIRGIEAVLEVYTRNTYIHPSYACEKLRYSYNTIKYIYEYFENKLNKENKGE